MFWKERKDTRIIIHHIFPKKINIHEYNSFNMNYYNYMTIASKSFTNAKNQCLFNDEFK